MKSPPLLRFLLLAGIFQAAAIAAQAAPAAKVYHHEWGRIISLDGEWEIAEGSRDTRPTEYPARIPVPGLVPSAQPAFRDVGVEGGPREVFWYRRTFKVDGEVPAVARLKIGKAMFGTTVYLNGREVGSSMHSFTPLYFSVRDALRGNGAENELVISVGAHISALPDTVISGGDPERQKYPPGIYDRVELILSGDPYVLRTQVAPRIEKKQIDVVVDLASDKAGGAMDLQAAVYEWRTGKRVASTRISAKAVPAGKTVQAKATIDIPDCKLWTPDSPELYVLELTRGKDRYETRFGMRSFRLDPDYTNRALLNGEPVFIRGTVLAVHRFFEDHLSRQHPWDEAWVRKLIRRFTGMGMNAARVCVGPAPELWYDIADEEGVMLFDEVAIWYAYQPEVGDVSEQRADPYKKWGIWPKGLTKEQLVKEYTEWMQERWNHPSVVLWDAQNETWAKQTGEALQAVRHLDLSNRPWDNGWSPPQAPSDVREAHPYVESWVAGTEMSNDRRLGPQPFTLDKLATAERVPSTFYLPFQYKLGMKPDWYWRQPIIINEYSYLWLHRDGTPTTLTKGYYDTVLGVNATPDQRRELYARYLAAVTEYWRATRSCIGMLYPFGIAGSIPNGATADSITNVEKIEFDPYFDKYVPDSFAPVGVCAELWQTEFIIEEWRGTQAEFPVTVINDTSAKLSDAFEIKVVQGDKVLSRHTYKYQAQPFELSRTFVRFELPSIPGKYEVITTIKGKNGKPVSSYRPVELRKKEKQ